MKTSALLSAAMAAAVTASPAWASDPVHLEKLAPKIGAACVPGRAVDAPPRATGTISADALRTAMREAGELSFSLSPAWLSSSQPLAPQISQAVFTDAADDPNHMTNGRLRRLVTGWAAGDESGDAPLPLSDGGVLVTGARGERVAGQGTAVLTAILAGESGPFVFHCVTATASVDTPRPVPDSRRLQIGRTFSDLGLETGAKKFAEAAFVDDAAGGAESYAFYGAAGLSWRDGGGRATPFGVLRSVNTLFAQIERQGSESTVDANEVNNLSLGAQFTGFLEVGDPASVHAFSFAGRYITDDGLDSELWSVTGRFTPSLRLPGYLAYSPVGRSDRLQWRWTATAVADWIEVEDPGDKAKLQTAPSFGRVGYDLAADMRWSLDPDASLTFGGSYARREDLTDGGGDADLLAARLTWSPSLNYAFSLVYEQGENLDTLEDIDQVKITLGFRR